jgi:hypothetical protein
MVVSFAIIRLNLPWRDARTQPLRKLSDAGSGAMSLNLMICRAVLTIAGFLLWTSASAFPLAAPIREGWDRPIYWQVGLPLVLAVQLLVALRSRERVVIQPLWLMLGHVVAMLFIHPAGTDLGLLPLAIIFMGVPIYAALLVAASIGRMVRRLTAPI